MSLEDYRYFKDICKLFPIGSEFLYMGIMFCVASHYAPTKLIWADYVDENGILQKATFNPEQLDVVDQRRPRPRRSGSGSDDSSTIPDEE